MKMNIETLRVFECSHSLTLDLYRLTALFPSEEKFGLISQIRRSCASICANLMEGNHRSSKNEYRHFVNISRGSAGELKYHLLLAKDLSYISDEIYQKYLGVITEITKMLHGLIKYLSDKP